MVARLWQVGVPHVHRYQLFVLLKLEFCLSESWLGSLFDFGSLVGVLAFSSERSSDVVYVVLEHIRVKY